jgi:predicted MFS family arabinose efflux permease
LSAPAAEPPNAVTGGPVLRRSTLSLLVLAVTFCFFTNLALLQALVPAEVGRLGGSTFEIGEATSLFSAATVACELLTVFLATRIAMATLLAAGVLVMGVGAFGYLFSAGSIPVLLALTAVRGGAFGVNAVTSSYLVAAYSDPRERGRAIGIYGLAVSLPATFGISLGLVILSASGPRPAYGLASLPPLVLGAWFAIAIRRTPPPPVPAPVMRLRALPRLLPLAGTMALVTMTYGALLSFGPALVAGSGPGAGALLFLGFGIARALSRPFAGLLSDRFGGLLLSVGSTFVLGLGCLLLGAWGGDGRTGIAVAAALYGIGLGGISNSGYVSMLDRVEASGQALASASWSVSFDGGVTLGGAAFALAAEIGGVGAIGRLLPAVAGAAFAWSVLEWGRARGRAGSRSAL